MKTRKSVDVVIVGAGGTGLPMAKELATRTGLDILALERGPARKPSDYGSDMLSAHTPSPPTAAESTSAVCG